MKFFRLTLTIIAALVSFSARAALSDTHAFLENHCFECHDADNLKGGLNLTALKTDPANPADYAQWVTIYDRVRAGEMPPKKKPRPKESETNSFLGTVLSSLTDYQKNKDKVEGRATERRMNRYEYEATLRDLLQAPYLDIKNFLPEDSEAFGFNKVGDALDVSHVQLARYLSASEYALRTVMAQQVERPELQTTRFYTWDEREFFGKIKLEGPLNRRTFPLVGHDLQTNLMAESKPKRTDISKTPDALEQEALAVVVSTYEPTEIRFSGFHAPVSGRAYKLRFSAYSIWMEHDYKGVSRGHRSEPVTIYAEVPPLSLRTLGSFDAQTEPTVSEMDVWLQAGETIRPDAARLFRARPPDFHNPLETPDGMPAVAFKWMEVEGPLLDQWPPPGHQLLFGKLPIEKSTNKDAESPIEAVSKDPSGDAESLLRNFMQHAYRTPVRDEDMKPFLGLIHTALGQGYSFTDAMIAGYTGVLSSPGFLYLKEKPGRLDDYALAERLSYFLWNSGPDDELRRLADRHQLHRPAMLAQQTDRL